MEAAKPITKYIDVKVELEQEKKNKYSNQLAELVKEHERIELDKKSAMAAFKKEMDENTERQREIANELIPGWTLQSVECRVLFDYINEEVSYFSVKTGELMKIEKMPPAGDLFKMVQEGRVFASIYSPDGQKQFRDCFFRVKELEGIIEFVEIDTNEVVATEPYKISHEKFKVMSAPVVEHSVWWRY